MKRSTPTEAYPNGLRCLTTLNTNGVALHIDFPKGRQLLESLEFYKILDEENLVLGKVKRHILAVVVPIPASEEKK